MLSDADADAATSKTASKARRRGSLGLSKALGLAFVAWGLYLGLRPLSDNSFLTHLATGRLILEQGSVPSQDPYSWTAAGQDWIVQSWLASLAYGLAERLGGEHGLQLLIAGLSALLAGLVWRLSRPAEGIVVRASLSALVVAVGTVTWSERPLLFGLVLLAVLLVVVHEEQDPRWLVAVMWLWVNVHGSFPLALILLGCLLVGTKLDGGDIEPLKRALLWAGVGTLAGALSPIGPRLLVFPAALLDKMDLLSNVIEWQSPSFSHTWTRIFLLYLIVAVLALVRRPSYRAAVPLVVFTVASLLAIRNVAVATIVLLPGTAACLTGLGSLTGSERNRASTVFTFAAAGLAAVVLVQGLQGPAFDYSTYPSVPLAWMEEQAIPLDEGGLVTSDVVGNYIEGVYGTEASVFVDDRYDMFPLELLEDFVVLFHGRPGWDEVLDRHGADVVLWERGTALSELLTASSDTWRPIYQDTEWLVVCRRGAEVCED